MLLVGTLIGWALTLYEWVLIARVVLSWVQVVNRQWTPRGALLVLSEVVYTLTDPPVKVVRRLVKPVRIGNMALDLSVVVIFVLIVLVMQINRVVFFS
ncbi:MAG: YggT family protein [Propionibacteriaceae bacterium]|jgi:YggT family protein|nr:YggT family protein [Propionibacteriaceae bacterium]